MSTNFDFNDDTDQARSFDVIPANTICTVQLTIKPGGEGEGGWLKRSADRASVGLDCEFTVVDTNYAKRKFWQLFTLEGTKEGHAEAGKISRDTFRAILESAHGFRFSGKSDAAQAARRTTGWHDFDGLRFVVRLGVRPPQGTYSAKNVILEIITPERQTWKQPEQLDRALFANKSANSGTAAPTIPVTAPANAIARPDWAQKQHG